MIREISACGKRVLRGAPCLAPRTCAYVMATLPLLFRGAARAVQPVWEPQLEVCHLLLVQLIECDLSSLDAAAHTSGWKHEVYVEMA